MYAELYLHETNIPRKTVTSICTCWLDGMYQPRSSVCTRRISLGLMINEDMPLTSSRRLIFGGLIIALWLTGKSFAAVKWELMKLTRRARVSLLSETGMFSMSLWMPSALISGCPLSLLLRWSAKVYAELYLLETNIRCVRLMVGVAAWGQIFE